jgi:hypothetical protein
MFWISLLSLIFASCSNELSFYEPFLYPYEEEKLSVLLETAQHHYDRGDFEKARAAIDKAERIAPQSEDIALLYGYIHLGLANVDTFALTKAMITKGDSAASLEGTSGGADAFLSSMSGRLVKATPSEIQNLGVIINDDNYSQFQQYPLYTPKNVTEIQDADLKALADLAKIIKKSCAFISLSLLDDNDARHLACKQRHVFASTKNKVLFQILWAFAHMAESLHYYKMIQYKDDSSELPHLQLRMNAIQSASLPLTQYVSHVSELASNVDAIFDSSSDSMFSATLRGLQIAARTLNDIANLPKQLKNSINKAIDSIDALKDSVSGGDDNLKEGNAFKNQLNKAISRELGSKITELAESDPDGFAANKDELCASYQQLSGLSEALAECE